MKKTLKIEGMSCMHCVKAVKNALDAIDGVEKADVDLDAKTATVEVDSAVSDDTLRAAVEEEGFTVVGI